MSPDADEIRRTSPADVAHERLGLDRARAEPQKSQHTILEQQVQQAREDLERRTMGLLLSGFSAGMDLGFGPLLMGVVLTLAQGEFSHATIVLLLANAYAVGFIFVVIGRSALFTEQTASAVMPVLAKRVRVARLLRLWGLVLGANLAGACVISAIGAVIGPDLGVIAPAAMGAIAAKVLQHSWWVILFSAVMAGWLMGLLAWVVVASRDTISQIVAVWLTTFVIGVSGFHHCVAGSVEVLTALFVGAGPTWADYGAFLLWSVIGNALGGSLFVALLRYGHVRASVVR